MPQIEKNEIYTSKEVEALLKISASTLKRLLKNGLIKANKIGGQYRFLGSEILMLVSPEVEEKARTAYRKLKAKAKVVTRDW